MKFKIYILSILFLLLGCKTLPKPQNNNGLLVIKVKTENQTTGDYYLHYNINIKDSDQKIKVHSRERLIIIPLEEGYYETDNIEYFRNYNLSKYKEPNTFTTFFNIKPNMVTLFPFTLNITLKDHPTKDGWIMQYQDFKFLNNEIKEEILTELNQFKNLHFWGINTDNDLDTNYAKYNIENSDDLFNKAKSNKFTDLKINLLTQTINLNPEHSEALYERGVIYYEEYDYENASKDFQDSLVLEPENPRAINYIAIINALNGNLNEAYDLFNKAITFSPEEPYLYDNMAYLHNLIKDYEEAISFSSKAIELAPDYPSYYARRAYSYIATSDFQNSLKDSEKALQLDKNFNLATYYKALCYTYMKEYKLALSQVDLAYKNGYKEPWVSNLLGSINLEQGKYKKANKYFTSNLVNFIQKYNSGNITKYSYEESLQFYYISLAVISYASDNIKDTNNYYSKLININPIFMRSTDEILSQFHLKPHEKELFIEMHNTLKLADFFWL